MLTKQVIEYKDFGVVKVALDELLKERKISTYELCKKADLRFQTVKNIRENPMPGRITLDTIAKICYVLECNVADFITYIPPKEP